MDANKLIKLKLVNEFDTGRQVMFIRMFSAFTNRKVKPKEIKDKMCNIVNDEWMG